MGIGDAGGPSPSPGPAGKSGMGTGRPGMPVIPAILSGQSGMGIGGVSAPWDPAMIAARANLPGQAPGLRLPTGSTPGPGEQRRALALMACCRGTCSMPAGLPPEDPDRGIITLQ